MYHPLAQMAVHAGQFFENGLLITVRGINNRSILNAELSAGFTEDRGRDWIETWAIYGQDPTRRALTRQ